jgi:hypothetical protein
VTLGEGKGGAKACPSIGHPGVGGGKSFRCQGVWKSRSIIGNPPTTQREKREMNERFNKQGRGSGPVRKSGRNSKPRPKWKPVQFPSCDSTHPAALVASPCGDLPNGCRTSRGPCTCGWLVGFDLASGVGSHFAISGRLRGQAFRPANDPVVTSPIELVRASVNAIQILEQRVHSRHSLDQTLRQRGGEDARVMTVVTMMAVVTVMRLLARATAAAMMSMVIMMTAAAMMASHLMMAVVTMMARRVMRRVTVVAGTVVAMVT